MRRLKLGTIISLVPEPTGPCRDLTEFCQTEKIAHIWHYVQKYDDGFSHTPELVASILSVLIDPRNLPLFLHCRDGAHNTGLVVMCLRRLQNWSLPTIYQEFIRYTKSNQISFEEKQFVESFHAAVKIPIRIPQWLWDGIRHRKHPSIRLELESETENRNPKSPTISEMQTLQSLGNQPSNSEAKSYRNGEREPNYVQIRTHYTRQASALDLCGVYFLGCCRPDIEGNVVTASHHTNR